LNGATTVPKHTDPNAIDVISFAERPPTLGAFLTVTEVAALLRCSKSSLDKWRLSGAGPKFVRVGSRIRYRAVDVAEFVAVQTRRSTSAA
jgi:excisionase family DNA binding protein